MIYEYSPAPKKALERHLRNSFLLLGVLLFSASFIPKVPFPGIFQLLAVFSFVVMIVFQTGYLGKTYSYRVVKNGGECDFEIEEHSARHNTIVCRVHLSEITALTPVASPETKNAQKGTGVKRFRYLGTLKSDDAYLLSAEVSGERIAVLIFADEKLRGLITAS